MEITTPAEAELALPNPIRVETALSRYPVHRLARKGGDITIDIKEKSERGEASIKWEVSHNKKYGQPGPMAYKLDTLIINRRIEEAPRPVPRIIRLGGFNDICRELGIAESGANTAHIRKSLHQNASAYITARIRYKYANGGEGSLETGFTRYGVTFTGSKLSNGQKADAIYITLKDEFMEVINGAVTRPLDYDYLRSLPPVPQRFYELLSYKVYAAISLDRDKAKLLYSYFCTHAPQTRYLTFDQVKKQMYKIHNVHRENGYIGKIAYEETVDNEGKPDWTMLYQPGPRARAEFRAFTKRGVSTLVEVEPLETNPLPLLAAPDPSPLEQELLSRGITNPSKLIAQYGEEYIREKIEILEYEMQKRPGKIEDPAKWLAAAVRDNHGKPKGFVSPADRKRRQEELRAKKLKADEERHREQEEKARDRAEREKIDAHWKSLTPEQQADIDAQAKPETLALEEGPLRRLGLSIHRDEHLRQLLRSHELITAE